MHRLPTIPVVLLYSYCIIFCCILPYKILCWYYIGYCNTECLLLSMLLRKPPCMYPALCLRIPSQEVGVESIERIPWNNLMCDGTKQMINGWYLIGCCDILINKRQPTLQASSKFGLSYTPCILALILQL